MEVRPGYKQTEVGMNPEDWELKGIGSIAGIFGGGTPSTIVVEYWDGQIPWVSAGDVSRAKGRYIHDTADHISELGLASCPTKIMPIGTTIIIARGATVGRMAQLGVAMAFNQTCYGLLPVSGLDQNYLYYAMLFSVKSMKALTYGTIFGTITTNYFDQWKILLPPTLAEQEAIAEALSDVDSLLAALDALIAKKRFNKQGVMQELLTGKTRLPGFCGEWEVKKLGEIGQCIRGVSYNGASDLSSHDNDGTTRLLRSNNIQKASVVLEELQFVNSAKVSKQQIMRTGDILICMANGSKELVGKSGRFDINDGFNYTFGAFMGCFRTNYTEADPSFVFNTFQTYKYRNYISILLAGSSINNLKPSSIESIDIPFPKKEEQLAIAAVLSNIDAEISALERQREKTHLMKQGMMQDLLTGKTRLI